MTRRYTEETLRQVISESAAWSEVCRRLGIKPATGSQTHIKSVAVRLGIDFSHFKGKSLQKGKTFPDKRKNIELYLSNELPIKSHTLRLRLIREGYKKPQCEMCGVEQWLGHPVPLELDHKDSNHLNNNLDNLQIVCPNCHAIATKTRKQK